MSRTSVRLLVAVSLFVALVGGYHLGQAQAATTTTLVTLKQPSSISIRIPYTDVPGGNAISLDGSVVPIPFESNRHVTVTYRRPDGSHLNATALITADGLYSHTFSPDDAGVWEVTASWTGDAALEGAVSPTKQFTARGSGTVGGSLIPTPVLVSGVALGVIVILVIHRRRIFRHTTSI